MKAFVHIVCWTAVAVLAVFGEYRISYWATQTEKEPDLQETAQFSPSDYPHIAAEITAANLQAHITALSSIPSRLTGTKGCDQAADYIMGQFRALGLGEPHVQKFPVTVPVFTRCEMKTAQGTYPLHPLYPNGVCPAAVPSGGLATRVIYAGYGRLDSVDGKDIQGATVVVMAGSHEPWLYLIDQGARAIVFVEHGRASNALYDFTQTGSPQNVPRFWMTRRDAEPLLAQLKKHDLKATLYSDARWEQRTGKNIWIDIPGLSKAARNRTERVVLESYYDSSSFVPDLAPGADQACGIAALLELAKIIRAHPFEKTVRILAMSGHFEALAGARQYIWDKVARYSVPMREVSPRGYSAFLGLDLSSHGSRVGLFYGGTFYRRATSSLQPQLSDLGHRATKYAAAVSKALGRDPDLAFIDTINPTSGKDWPSFMPAGLALDHEVALLAGVPALSFVTTNDTRYYTGTPDDTTVNIGNLVAQTQLLACLLPNAFNVEGRYIKRSLPRSACELTGRVVTFDPRTSYLPDKPIPHALVRIHPQWWSGMFHAGVAMMPVVTANAQGVFHVPGLAIKEDIWGGGQTSVAAEPFVVKRGAITWAADFGQMGKESYPITTTPVQKKMQLMCVVFPCKTLDLYSLVDPRTFSYLSTLDVLDAANESTPPMYGTSLVDSSWPSYQSPTATVYARAGSRLKLAVGPGLAQKRMLLLNAPAKPPAGQLFDLGQGFAINHTPAIHRIYMQSARDMWRLDESRIRFFASHGIENARVNRLHKLAAGALKQAQKALDGKRYQELSVESRRALSLESRAYPDVLGMANDVVRGLVFYLVLLMPFAFAMERLFLAGRRIETRIFGIVGIFLLMFFALRFTHPAFQIVLSPMIVLLGFVVAALSTVVISIVTAKLEALVSSQKVTQEGQHESNVQAVSGFALALEMGLANMRRRKARTVLTSVTLIVLTFSVLSFVSVRAQLRTQQYVYDEGATPYKGVLLRTRNWAPFPYDTYAALRNELGQTCTLAPRRWYYGALVLNKSFVDVQMGKTVRTVAALTGLTAQEEKFEDIKSALLGKSRWLSPESDGEAPKAEALIPLNLAADFTGEQWAKKEADGALTHAQERQLANGMLGKNVSMLGRTFKVIGVFDWKRMNQLVDIDGESLSPYDPLEMEKRNEELGAPNPETVQRYIHHSFRDVVITSGSILSHLGGNLRSVAILPHDPSKLKGLLASLVRQMDFVLFANVNGTPMLLSSRDSTQISQIWNLIVLMAISGLIVFNTMLGSVFERTKEIATYTALGIAPSHIGRLFLVEAGVFSVIGVMAGYVLGQTVSRVVSVVHIPIFSALNLNYSSLAGVGACVVVMGMVMLSSLYPARKASQLGVPDIERRWKLPRTKQSDVDLELPFTVSPREAPGLVAFLKEYLDSHVDVSIGGFYVENVEAGPQVAQGEGTGLAAQFWLTPFDLGVSQFTTFTLRLLEGMDVCGVNVHIERLSGDAGSWRRANGKFITAMRSQFLMWRSLSPVTRSMYVERGKDYAPA